MNGKLVGGWDAEFATLCRRHRRRAVAVSVVEEGAIHLAAPDPKLGEWVKAMLTLGQEDAKRRVARIAAQAAAAELLGDGESS